MDGKTLLIYDNTGTIYTTMSGSYAIPQGGVQYIEVSVPIGKTPVRVDISVTPNVPVFGDLPVDPVTAKFAELEGIIAQQNEKIANAENIAYMGLECSLEVYEEVYPFLP